MFRFCNERVRVLVFVCVRMRVHLLMFQTQSQTSMIHLPVGDTWRLAPLPPVIAASVTRFCMLIGFIAENTQIFTFQRDYQLSTSKQLMHSHHYIHSGQLTLLVSYILYIQLCHPLLCHLQYNVQVPSCCYKLYTIWCSLTILLLRWCITATTYTSSGLD